MVICVQRHANDSEQTTLLDGVNFAPPKFAYKGVAYIDHEGMNISNIKVHLKTHS